MTITVLVLCKTATKGTREQKERADKRNIHQAVSIAELVVT